MKITDLQETKNFVFSQPTRQTALMIFVLLCVFFIAYLLFPAVGEAIILPELLTEDLLLDFLNKIN